jgi:glycosyltransferase involved in cell wall biosynthesis
LRLDGRRVVLFGGRLAREKGDQQLLAALRQVREPVPDMALLVLSRDANYTAQLRRDHPDLADCIVAGGWLEDAELAAAYRLTDVVVSPSVCFDSFPTMNLEGMAAGAPPVTTCFGGGREAVVDGETGFVVNPYNTAALAERLVRLLADEALRQRLAEAGRARVRTMFTLAHQTSAMLEVYQRALSRRRGVKSERQTTW